jgi:hypothetical protein
MNRTLLLVKVRGCMAAGSEEPEKDNRRGGGGWRKEDK